MERRRLGSLEVSALGLGCMGMAGVSGMAAMDGPGDRAEAIATLHRALEIGMDFLDTAGAASLTLSAEDLAALDASAPIGATSGERHGNPATMKMVRLGRTGPQG